MAGYRRIPVRARTRVIVDNDHAGDPDGLVALAHQLLVESTLVTAVIGTSIATREGDEHVQNAAQAAADELIERLAPDVRPRTCADTSRRLLELDGVPLGAQAIVEEALRDDERPLIVTCGGPLTNVSASLRAEPRIAELMTVAWIGGGGPPAGGWGANPSAELPAREGGL